MDFSLLFQLRNKKVWWMDVIFYFVMSLLIATVLCYLVFIVKNIIQRNQIADYEAKLQTVGTPEQKEQEAEVILYKKKIGDFGSLIQNHEFASNVFKFLEEQTQPNVWFDQFSLDAKNNQIQLNGEAEDMSAFSRQTATFEKNEYVRNLGTFNSSLGESGQIEFNVSLLLDPKIFSYAVNAKNKKEAEAQIEAQQVEVVSGSLVQTTTTQETAEGEVTAGTKSNEKSILSFAVPMGSAPEVVATLDQMNHAILINVPSGTDIANLTPTIIVSEKATVYPESGVPQNFTNTINYQVTAEDGTTQEYTVTAMVTQTEAEKKASEKGSGAVRIFLIIALFAFLIIVSLVIFLFIRNRKNKANKK